MNRLVCAFSRNLRISAPVREYVNSSVLRSSLPGNLQLADPKVLESEPAPIIPPVEYAFPILNVPTSIPVKKFLVPDAPSSELGSTRMERKIFEVAIRRDIVHNVIRYIRHQRRQPKKTKRLNEISGSKKKPRPQKGTGQAQVGNKRNSVWRKGQKAFGPVIRDYSIGMMRKERALGMMISLAAKYREGNLIVVDSLKLPSHKTKTLSDALRGHGLADKSVLLVDLDYGVDRNLILAGNNLPDVTVMQRRFSNVYEIVKKDVLVVSEAAFEDIQQRVMYQYTYSAKRRTMLTQQAILQECADLAELKRIEEGAEQRADSSA